MSLWKSHFDVITILIINFDVKIIARRKGKMALEIVTDGYSDKTEKND